MLPSPASYIREERFQRGDTLPAFLSRLGIAEEELATLARQRPLQALRPGSNVAAEVSDEGKLLVLSFLTARDTLVQLAREGEGFRATEERAALYTQVAMKSSVVQSSLFAASDAAGIPDSVAMQLADIFGGDVDFHRDLRKGDRFSVVYEMHHFSGRPVRAGRVLAAEFVNQGNVFRAVFFRDPQGRSGYYTPDGRNMRKAFLRSPIEFSRVTSGFSSSRFHPVLKTWRAHKGIDYGAPTGTRVRATADGYVTFAGRKGGYGNVVTVRHPNGYTTVYAHLSGIAQGVRQGRRVIQGEVVGSVGSTGLATGPHLHYEFHVNGVHQNPMRLAMPPGPPVTARLRPEFEEAARPLFARLDMLRDTNLARLD